MTREEIVEGLKLLEDNMVYFDELQNDKGEWVDVHELLFEAIQALSQEPCDDTYNIRKDILKCRVGDIVAYNAEWLKKHWQMEMDIVCGVKPCDDAISRDAVYSILNEHHIDEDRIKSDMDERQNLTVNSIASDVSLLPSVTQKSGKWTNKDVRKEEYVLTGKCSVCGQVRVIDKYCANCGAKMESEE